MPKAKVRIEIEEAMVCMGRLAKASIFVDEILVAEISADIDLQVGADGEMYPCPDLHLSIKEQE